MPILFNRCASLQVDPIISTSVRSIISSSQRCYLFRLQVAFVFPTLPPFVFLQGFRFLIQVSFIDGKHLHSFSSIFLSSDTHEDANEVSSSSFFILFLLRWNQFKLSVLIIFFSSCQMISHAGAPLNHSPLDIHLFWSVEDMLEDLCFHS